MRRLYEPYSSVVHFVFPPTMAEQADDLYFQQFLNEKPTVTELLEHVRVDTKWYTFGVLLNLDTLKLDDISLMNEATDFKVLKMFELWLTTNPNATRREIIETLQKEAISESAVAEEYMKVLWKTIRESE